MTMQWVGSPNFTPGRAGKAITLIVVHHMAGTLAATDAVFQDRQRNTSAHYGVGRDGAIHQYVQESDTAYHAGNWDINLTSIGIEHEDLNTNDYTDVEYQTSAQLIHDICLRHGIPIDADHIKPHRAFTATQCPGTLDITKLIQEAQMSTVSDDLLDWIVNHAKLEVYGVAGKPDQYLTFRIRDPQMLQQTLHCDPKDNKTVDAYKPSALQAEINALKGTYTPVTDTLYRKV